MDRSGKKRTVGYALVSGRAIVEGDIILGTEIQVRRNAKPAAESEGRWDIMGGGIAGEKWRWPGKRVPYLIDKSLSDPERVKEAIAHWEAMTEFRFPKRVNEKDYIVFVPGDGCASYIGRQGGEQFVEIGLECGAGNVIHEIGHVVGLWHEQCRDDRDTYVQILKENIISGYERNFERIRDSLRLGRYDYDSVMHYPSNAFSKTNLLTIQAPVAIGQRRKLSDGDIAAVHQLYTNKTVNLLFPEE